jgi:hypothetical protein
MSSYDPFEYLKQKLWPKEGSGVKLPIWLPTTKSRPDFLVCRWHATYRWKAVNKGYNFTLDLTSIGGLHTKLWAPKVVGVLTLGIWRLPFGSPRTKWHLGAGPVAMHKIYYKGEGGGFPQVRAVVSFMSPCLPVIRPCTKGVRTSH